MAYLKVYKWERDTWPWQRRINIQPYYRVRLTLKLAEYFGVEVKVTLTTRSRGAWYIPSQHRIALPNWQHKCSLGTIIHELSHAVNHQLYNGSHHDKSFQGVLTYVYYQTRPVLKLVLSEIHTAHVEQLRYLSNPIDPLKQPASNTALTRAACAETK